MCRCPLARMSWEAMAKSESMTRLEDITNTGTEWALHLLNRCTEEQRLPVIMTLWRSWHVRNEVVHQKPAPAIEASRRLLCSYIDNLRCIQQHPHEDIVKGKMIMYTRS
uniref:Uncharacterized protein n=1 Tax=Triticum urartu TaxID=4572 RepID=A0A8R7TL47_TRIUA